MPPVGPVWNVDWLNANAQRAYPLSEVATRKDVSGDFILPDDFIVDLVWPVQASTTIDPAKFHIAGVGIFGGGVTVAIGYDGTVIGNVSITSAGFIRNTTYFISGSGNFFDTVGKIVIGSLTEVMKGSGSFIFDLNGGRLEPTTIRPDLRGVSSLYVKNGEEISDAIQGDVVLEAGTNFRIQLIDAIGLEPNRIRFSAIDGAGFNQDCSCVENTDLPSIKTINGISPNSNGNFLLQGDDCLKLTAITNGLKVADECSKPCCGCQELDVVQSTLTTVLNQVTSLENLAYRLETAVNALQTNLIASKVGSTI